jgi:3-oxoacid CoA-transferase
MVETGGIPLKLGRFGWPTLLSKKKTRATFEGHHYIRERSIIGDIAFVKAWKADEEGNLLFRKAARNFNPDLAMAGKLCIAEVDEVLPYGAIDPDAVHLPGVYVHRIVKTEVSEKRIEKRTVHVEGKVESVDKRAQIAMRASKELKDGMYVNLGIGIPTLCANYLEQGVHITL